MTTNQSTKDSSPQNVSSQSGINRREILKATGASLTTGALAGCSGIGGGGSNTFKIGGIWALSQGWGTWGKMQKQHTQLAIKQINANGGVDGKDVELVLEDSKIDPKTTTEKARKLIQQDNVDVLLGPNSSASRAAMSQVANKNEVPHLYPLYYEGVTAPDYCRKWLFKFSGVPYGSAKPIAPYAIENFGKKFYLIGADYVWPHATNKQIKKFVKENGGEIVGETYVAINTSDYSSILPKIEDKNPDVVWSTLTGGSLPFQQQAYNRGLRDKWQEIHMSLTPLGVKGKKPGPLNGVLEPHVYYPSQTNKENKKLIKGMKDEYGDKAIFDTIGGVFYTATKAIPQAVENGGGTSNTAILKGLEQLKDFPSPMGKISMADDHQTRLTYKLAEIDMKSNEPYWKAHKVSKKFGPLAPPEQCKNI